MPPEAIEKIRIWRNDPGRFVTDVLDATPEPWQAEALCAVVDHDRVAVRSGHGVGKTVFLAWVVLWWLSTRFPAKVACTAPTAHQLKDVLWGEIARWHRKMPSAMQAQFTVTSDAVIVSQESFAVARTARKEKPEAFQGFHSEHMLFVVDEASGVEEIIFEVGQGVMSTPGAKTILTGNPTRTSGYFFEAFHRDRARWWTRRVAAGESSYNAPNYATDVALKYGEHSNVYRVRVLGEFPLSEDDVIIPLHLVESAVERDIDPVWPVVWGVDVARFGDDRTALCKRTTNALLEPIKHWRQKDTMQVAGLVAQEWGETAKDRRPDRIMVDVIGLGAGVVDRLKELGLPVVGVNVAEAASVQDQYMRLRDELWFKARDWFEAKDCRFVRDEELIGELVSVKYHVTSGGKIQAESKDDMKKRGMASPDLADAFVLTFAYGGPGRRRPVEFATHGYGVLDGEFAADDYDPFGG